MTDCISGGHGRVSRSQFDAIFAACRNWGRWGAHDYRGALNFISEEDVRAAAALVRRGCTISCARDLETAAGPDNPRPVIHHMTVLQDIEAGGSGDLRFTGDYLGIEIHGDAPSHIDALCHVVFEGSVFNGLPVASAVSSDGANLATISAACDGIVARGVLLDLPRLHGVQWLEPGHSIGADELLAAERQAGTQLRRGDVLFLRTGHATRRREKGPWDAAKLHAGLDVSAMPLLHERCIAALACDADGDTAPSGCDEIPYPIHAIGIVAMGLHFVDHLQLDDLATACKEENRWEFFSAIAPLRLPRGTGSPVNPIAVL